VRNPTQLVLRMMVACTFLFVATICSAQATLPQAQEKFDEGDYREALKLISQGLSTPRLAPNQRYALLMLRGESLLRLDERSLAIDAYKSAAEAKAGAKETAVARATCALIRKSQKSMYRPMSAGGSTEPIDIVDPESRKKAFAALYADSQAMMQKKVEAALRATTLPPIVEVIQPLLDQGAMEYLATGSAPQTRQTLTELGDHARQLMSAELQRVAYRIDQLRDTSTSITGDQWGFGQRGLQIPEQRELQDLVTYVRQIQTTAQRARARARELDFDGSAWEPIISDAAELADRGEAVLNTQQ
jgi:hypothetical protein